MTKESEIEREAVVRWLRDDAEATRRRHWPLNEALAEELMRRCDAIERGDHLKERG